MSNRSLGNTFEAELAQILYEQGFWVHLLNQNKSGQPADIIAVRNGKAYLIDAKVCSSRGFDLSRVEENQDLAMDLWNLRGNGQGWFAIKIENSIYMLPHFLVKAYRNQQSSLSLANIVELGKPLEKWVARCK